MVVMNTLMLISIAVFMRVLFLSGNYAASLMTDYTGNPCRGQQVNLTCTVDGPVLIWDLPEFSNRLILSNATSTLNTPSIIVTSTNASAVAILISNTNGLVSIISVTVQENITVQCSDPTDTTSLQSHRITLAGSPGPPQSVRHSIEDSTANNVTMLVEWSPPADNGGRDDFTYTVIILPPLSGLPNSTTSPYISITVQYDISYTLTITSVSCGGESSSLDYLLTFSLINLNVEGEVSLIGPHCPGTLRLFCEGTDLNSLYWSYNGSLEIIQFGPDDSETTTTLSPDQYPAFVLVELTKAVQNLDRVFGNISSILTVDLSKLEEESVTNISCGDLLTSETVPVGVTIIKQVTPDSPNINEVTATYDSRHSLKRITVVWNKVLTGCPEYAFSLDYIVQLNGLVPLRVNHSSCGEISCLAVFNAPFPQSNPVNSYFLSLTAMNNIGNSSIVQFPTIDSSQSEQYITPVLNSNGCITSGQCLSSGSLHKDTTCHVQYTTDPEYQGLSTVIMVPLNTLFEVPRLTSGTIFYFVFSVPVTSTFHVSEQFELTTESGPQLTSSNMATIAFAVVFVIFSLILFIVSLIIISVGHVRGLFNHGNWLMTILVSSVICVLLLISCLALLLAVGVVVGTQEDTCNADWLQERDRLIISTLIISLSSVIASLIYFDGYCFILHLSWNEDEHQSTVDKCQNDIAMKITRKKQNAIEPSIKITYAGETGERPSDKNTNLPKPSAPLSTGNNETETVQGVENKEKQGFISRLKSLFLGRKETTQVSNPQSVHSSTYLRITEQF